MKALADLYLALDQTNKTLEKVEILADFFLHAPPGEKVWALALLSGRRPRRQVNTTRLREWAAEQAGIPLWLFNECYDHTGDLAETIALLLPPPQARSARSTSEWVEILSQLKGLGEQEQRQVLTDAWDCLSTGERLVFNKLITGEFRIGVSQALVTRALSEVTGTDKTLLAHRLMGNWNPAAISFDALVSSERSATDISQPYPFCLAHALDREPQELGPVSDWLIEWKWDGIRGQLIKRSDSLFLWSRGEELVTDRFPELRQLQGCLPDGAVLDGEILPFQAGRPLGFSLLQTRIGRKNVTPQLMRTAPVVFMAYDVLEWEGVDLREKPLQQRRQQLEDFLARQPCRTATPLLLLSEAVEPAGWEQVQELRTRARDHFAEGLMLKRLDSPYAGGRIKGLWWKWKVDPLSVDAVLVHAQPGHGRRATLFTDYTFAVWNGDQLVPFAKAYSGLSDKEIREVDTFVKRHTLEKHGPVRTVAPELVFELGFENIAPSKRHRAGVAVRFPRILRWRRDKKAADADTLDTLKALIHLPTPAQPARQQLELFD
jgi:DNA ligase 1